VDLGASVGLWEVDCRARRLNGGILWTELGVGNWLTMVCDSDKNRERKGKEECLYSAICILCISQSAQAWITQFYLHIHHACLSLVSVHQMAPPLTEVGDIQLQLSTHLSAPRSQWILFFWYWFPRLALDKGLLTEFLSCKWHSL